MRQRGDGPVLLVSVAGTEDAREACAGGADIVDAKDPAAGALGPVTRDTFAAIVAAVAGSRPVSAALGDRVEPAAAEREARAFARAGAAFVKLGVPVGATAGAAGAVLEAALQGAGPGCGVVAVAFVDLGSPSGAALDEWAACALEAGAAGVLLDTSAKDGPGLLRCLSAPVLEAFVTGVHAHRSAAQGHAPGRSPRGSTPEPPMPLVAPFVALAGRLGHDDLPCVASLRADIAGVRGAACDGGRLGRVRAERVRRLRAALR